MGWELARWIVSVRSLQLMGSFIPGALNGWLLYWIDHKGITLAQSMIILQILITLLFSYTLLSLVVMHGYKFAQRPQWMTGSVCFDVVFCFLAVAIISILGIAGVPDNCSGLSITVNITSPSVSKQDRIGLEHSGFNAMGFTDEKGPNRGTLDQYCGMERAFYFFTLAIILSFIFIIIMSVISVCQMRMYSKKELHDLLQERENMIKLEYKIQEQEALSTPTPTQNMSPVAPQSNDGFPANNTRPNSLSRPMSRTTYQTTPSSSSRPTRPGLRYAADSIPGPSSSSSSSYRGRGQQQQPHHNEPVSPLSPDSPVPSSSIAPLPHDRGFILSATDVSANLAMVADGSRGYTPGQSHAHQAAGAVELPPYSPGNNMRAMHGHGGESNDIRLSEYVKGATAAQDMKDSNGF